MDEILFGIFLAILGVVGYFVYIAIRNDDYDVKYKDAPKKTPKKSIIALWIILPIALMTLIACVQSVGTGDIAVMTRFGHVTGQELQSGLHFKNPIDHANIYDVKVQKSQTTAEAASLDLQDVNSTVVVNYHLNQGSVFDIHKNVGVNYHQILIDPAIQESFKATTAKFDATQLIDNRSQVKADETTALANRLKPYGIIVDSVNITNFGFSKEFSDSIEKKQVAQQQAEQAQFNLQKATVDAQANQAQTSALTPQILEQQAINKWDGKLPTTMAGGTSTVFNIPLQ